MRCLRVRLFAGWKVLCSGNVRSGNVRSGNIRRRVFVVVFLVAANCGGQIIINRL